MENVTILNSKGGVVFEGDAFVTNRETDPETECPMGTAQLIGLHVRVWKIDGKWQGRVLS